LIKQIENIFRRGVRNSKMSSLKISDKPSMSYDSNNEADTISHADSLLFIQEGLIEAPIVPATTTEQTTTDKTSKKRKSTKSNSTSQTTSAAVLNDDKKKK
jgi:hypothetical protein